MPRLLLPIALLALLCLAAPARAAIVGPPVVDTTITGGPAEGATVEGEEVAFSFEATLSGAPFPGAVFHCSIDDEPAEVCTSPFQLDSLEEDGLYNFSVYAEDPLTLTRDPEPARRSFFLETGECEEYEDEEGNVEECEEEDTSPYPPSECLLRTARARVFTYSARDKVRLVIRYTSYAPADVTVRFRLNGGKGSLKLGEVKQRFAKKGLFRLTEKLTKAQAARVRASKRFSVEMDIPAAPSFCHRYDTRHLTIKRTIHNQVVWFQSDSIFGT